MLNDPKNNPVLASLISLLTDEAEDSPELSSQLEMLSTITPLPVSASKEVMSKHYLDTLGYDPSVYFDAKSISEEFGKLVGKDASLDEAELLTKAIAHKIKLEDSFLRKVLFETLKHDYGKIFGDLDTFEDDIDSEFILALESEEFLDDPDEDIGESNADFYDEDDEDDSKIVDLEFDFD